MRKILIAICVVACMASNVFALEIKMLDMRKNLFAASQEIKDALPTSKDSYAMLSMFNSCLMTTSQLDAYFHMVGIFDTIKKENLSAGAADFLTAWLQQVQKTNQLNLDSLATLALSVEPATKVYTDKVRVLFSELGGALSEELNKVAALKKSAGASAPAKKIGVKK